MKIYKLSMVFIAMCASLLFVQCSDDDDNVIDLQTCNDGIQNGSETGVDCGGTACEPCADGEINFSGTFMQEDIMGRPGINTVFSGTDEVKNNFNTTTVTGRADFTPIFENTLETYHDVYAVSLGLDPEDVNYVPNILGLDATTFATVLSQFDALQVAPNAQTVYFDPSTGVALTGRNINDDVIDISLILMFGGGDLNNLNFDGTDGSPLLISDSVGFGDRQVVDFPYLETPN
ncbi:hypothetical protein [Marixanthomonas ophiurae]|uniref:DUF4331 domain-containing protein n=1 Tax=Marixanthomonas ophiurae TaxID=387659 RepID=A0A3E1QDF1_9FLAO|nr:hypothetical protein [Marixanthomonas ophiurae]RFN60137.1 hypothetical protein DZ858_08870 [Marixanthomonas ophiurae]